MSKAFVFILALIAAMALSTEAITCYAGKCGMADFPCATSITAKTTSDDFCTAAVVDCSKKSTSGNPASVEVGYWLKGCFHV
jgi:hypothetical protein